MADSKITALTAISTVDPTADPLVIVDVSDTSMAASGTTKKSTINQLLGAGGTATLASATITGDLTVDTNVLKVDTTNDRVGIGTATPALPLDVAGGIQVTSGSAGGLFQWAYGASASSRSWRAWNDVSANGDFQISTSTTRTGSTYSDRYRIDVTGIHEWSNTSGTAMTLNSTGLGVGVVPANDKLLVLNTIGINTATTGDLSFRNVVGTAQQRIRYNDSDGSLTIGSAQAVSYALYFGGNTTTRAMTLDASGNLILQSSATPATLTTNGQLTVNATSNTNLRFSYRGSDGTTRVANITLA